MIHVQRTLVNAVNTFLESSAIGETALGEPNILWD
jgi:hypothetical protein